jgi:casein kinase II subunit alpha
MCSLMRYEKKPWSEFINQSNIQFCSNEAIDFLNGLLVYDHQKRLTPVEAMKCKYFDVLGYD